MTDDPTTPRSEPELLPPVALSPISEYNATESALAELRHQVTNATIDCSTPAGDKIARQSRFALVKLRTALEAERVRIKAPALERCRQIDAEAKRITTEIEALEKPFDDAIRAQEAKIAAEKADAERREQARRAAVEAEIEGVRRAPLGFLTATPAAVAAELDRIRGLTFDHFADPVERDRAQTAQREAIGSLAAIHEQRLQHEREQAKIAADRAENERIAAQARQRQAEEDAARAEQQRLEDEKRAAERAEEERAAAQRRAEEQAEGERRRRNETILRKVREMPVELLHAPASTINDAINAINEATANTAGVDDDYVDAFHAASVEARNHLQQMLDAQLLREQQEKEYRELRARQAEEARAADEQRKREQEQREQAAIAEATLRSAAEDALELLLTFVDEDNLTVRKLGAALAREATP